MVDPIADMITRIQNAGNVGKETVSIPYSKMKYSIAGLLQQYNFIVSVEKKGKKISKSLEITLAYDDKKQPKINGARRISKFSRRMYSGAKDIKSVKNNTGLVVLSTSKGILSGERARKEHVGGEVMFNIW